MVSKLSRFKFTVIVAYSLNRVIGQNNQLPWHIPADLKRFKALTMGKALLMGRKTYDSIGRPLPGRRMIVLSRDTGLHLEGCEVIHDLDQLAGILTPGEEVMVAGGEQIFKLLLPHTQKMLLTEVQAEVDGDTFFPEYKPDEWVETSREVHRAGDDSPYDYAFVELLRR